MYLFKNMFCLNIVQLFLNAIYSKWTDFKGALKIVVDNMVSLFRENYFLIIFM